MKAMLDECGLVGVAKTSGAGAMHILLPLARATCDESARLLAELVATRVANSHAKLAMVVRGISRRPARAMYVDFRSIRGKTITAGLDPQAFTIATAPERILAMGDLWWEGLRVRNRPGGLSVA